MPPDTSHHAPAPDDPDAGQHHPEQSGGDRFANAVLGHLRVLRAVPEVDGVVILGALVAGVAAKQADLDRAVVRGFGAGLAPEDAAGVCAAAELIRPAPQFVIVRS